MVGATIMGIHLVLIFGDSTPGTEITSGDRDDLRGPRFSGPADSL